MAEGRRSSHYATSTTQTRTKKIFLLRRWFAVGSSLTYSVDRWAILYLGLKIDVVTAVITGILDIWLLIALGNLYDRMRWCDIEAEIGNERNPLLRHLRKCSKIH